MIVQVHAVLRLAAVPPPKRRVCAPTLSLVGSVVTPSSVVRASAEESVDETPGRSHAALERPEAAGSVGAALGGRPRLPVALERPPPL
jgi:hypothetical protein